MITIQSGMLVALGFLAASLLGLLIAPLFWARAVRLTSKRIKESMPLTDIEIRADKDRIRAEYAIKVHKLESEIEQVRLSTARQQIEINRRDAAVNTLESELEHLRANNEEMQNARRVLEQTISDRLPRVEQGLSEAKRLLFTRDREIGELTRTGERHLSALDEAKAIASQQQSEIAQLTTELAARDNATRASGQIDGELALRSEIEMLRGKTREQAQLLARLQSMVGHAAAPTEDSRVNGAHLNGETSPTNGELGRQLRLMKSRNDDQASEIARLKAAVAVFENSLDDDGKTSLRESRIGQKARVQSLEAQSQQQTETIQRLRSDLAAANERLARQASYFHAELRRLGGSNGASIAQQGRRSPEPAARLSLTERVAQSRGPADASPNIEALPAAVKVAVPAKAGAIDATALSPEAASVPFDTTDASGASQSFDTADATTGEPNTRDPNTREPAAERPRLLDRIANLARN